MAYIGARVDINCSSFNGYGQIIAALHRMFAHCRGLATI